MSGRTEEHPDDIRSGSALFTFDESQRIRSWNAAAEKLTGVPAASVVGRPCWDVLCAHDEAGGLVCHAGCSFHRLLRERWPVAPPTLVIRTAAGAKRVNVPMVTIRDGLFAALLVEADAEPAMQAVPADGGPTPSLTPRQRTVLEMLVDGKPARTIAQELHLSEMTVRNHIRAILRELGCRSQLAAVAEARRLRLLERGPRSSP